MERHGKAEINLCRIDFCTPDAPSPFRVNKKQNKGIPKDGLSPADSSHHTPASIAMFIKETLGFMVEEVT